MEQHTHTSVGRYAGWSLVSKSHVTAGALRWAREHCAHLPQNVVAEALDLLFAGPEIALFADSELAAFHDFAAACPDLRLTVCAAELSDEAELPPGWLAPVAAVWAALERKLHDKTIPDDVLLDTVAETAAGLPNLMESMDVGGLAAAFEAGMGQAAIAEALRAASGRKQITTLAVKAGGISVPFAPIEEGLNRLRGKTPIAAQLSSSQWARMPIELRERALFSARVESMRFLTEMQRKLDARLGMERELLANGKSAFVDRGSFIVDMRRIAEEEGLRTTGPVGDGTVRDIRSVKRLGLIWDMQTQSAAGFARWKIDNDADVLDEWPAYRLLPSTANDPRDESFWAARWQSAGNKVGWQGAAQGDYVALKTSPIWRALSRFGTPWPPFDYGSKRELDDVDRAEAEALGLLERGSRVPGFEHGSDRESFNAALDASVEGLSDAQIADLREAYGDQIEVADGRVQWRGGV